LPTRACSAVTAGTTTRLGQKPDSALFQLRRILIHFGHLVLNLSGDQKPPLNPGRNNVFLAPTLLGLGVCILVGQCLNGTSVRRAVFAVTVSTVVLLAHTRIG
jgi:hypothetical protein